MRFTGRLTKLFAVALCAAVFVAPISLSAQSVSYDIVYVRAPRSGDTTFVKLPEVFNPVDIPANTDLMLLHPDGSEEVLVAGGNGAILDPFISFDGRKVYYTRFHDQRSQTINSQRGVSRAGSDIYAIDLATRVETRLTNQEWTPNTGVTDWASDPHNSANQPGKTYLGFGIFNMHPAPISGGKIMFVSSRNSFIPVKGFTNPNLQLYIMDEDGKNVELIGHMNLGSALHPVQLVDGRVMFSSYESQGLRDDRNWALWSVWPDGRVFEPLMSAFVEGGAFHFQTQLSNGDISVVQYYNLNNNGFGTLLAFPAAIDPSRPPFGSAVPNHSSNPAVRRGVWYFSPSHPSHLQPRYSKFPFSPQGLYALSAFSHGEDEASTRTVAGGWEGKVTHPSGAPGNDVLVAFSTGPANGLNRPTNVPYYDSGISIIRGGSPVTASAQMTHVKNDPAYNEMQPRAVVSFRDVYGVTEPHRFKFLPNNGSVSNHLPAGTPFGLVGTSSFIRRDTKPGIGSARFSGLDPFNTAENGASSNWSEQGAEAGRYSNEDIFAVRVLAMEPTTNRSYPFGPWARTFTNAAGERLRILGEIPLRKFNAQGQPILDQNGDPDTSFLAKIPADVPFTFQTLDRDGLVLNMAQTWHQVRPGEERVNCGGCHAHSQMGTPFEGTEASKPGFQLADLTKETPLLTKDGSGNPALVKKSKAVDVEFYRDIRPILNRSCIGSCHNKLNPNPDAKLVLDDTAIVNGRDNTYNRLCNDSAAQYGIKPVISNGAWRQSNASRYVRHFQSRRSLLIWKIFGRRLDGWLNSDHPTESTPGDPSTLPAGANRNEADLDYTGTIMPPPSSGLPPLSEDEKITFARWIDLGCPISENAADGAAQSGWFMDELRPTLTIAAPRGNVNTPAVSQLRIGMHDYKSGLNMATFSVKATVPVNGAAAGAELAPQFTQSADHVWTLNLSPPLTNIPEAELTVSVKDNQGNIVSLKRRFSVQTVARPAAPSALTAQEVIAQ